MMNQIVEELYRLYDRFCTMPSPVLQTPSVKSFYDELVALLATPLTDSEAQAVISQIPFKQDLTHRHAMLHLMSEKKVAESYLSGDIEDLFESTWFDKLLPDVLKAQAEQWKALGLDFSKDDKKIAMLGGGALPQSQIHFSTYSGSPVTCIDRDEEVVSLLSGVLKKLNREDLPVIRGSGDQMDYSPFDLVVIAAMVEGKSRVVRRIRETSQAKICIRNPAGLHQLMREPISIHKVEAFGYRLMGQSRQGNSISMVFEPR